LCLKITCAESIKNGITFLFGNGMEGLEPQSLRIMDEIGVKGLITDWDLYEACKHTEDIKRVALALWHEGEEEFKSNYDGQVTHSMVLRKRFFE